MNAAAPSKTSVTVFPATESTVNDVPESQIIRPMDVMAGPYFYSYNPNTNSINNKFKPIVQYDQDNSRNSGSVTMSVSVQKSTTQGSEWGGNVEFTGEIKAGILGAVSTKIGGSYKQTRSTNEAVGASASMTVSPGKIGHIKFWYKGRTTGGSLRTYTYNTANPSVRYYLDTPINATFYSADYLDVWGESWQS